RLLRRGWHTQCHEHCAQSTAKDVLRHRVSPPSRLLPYASSSHDTMPCDCTALLNHLVRLQQECRGYGEAKRLGGLEVDHQLKFRESLHRQIRRFRAFEDLVDEGGGTAGPIKRV